CIDKSSSAELSEAINSMWKWYQKAVVCYAYLDDIDCDDALPMGSWSITNWESDTFWERNMDVIDEKALGRAKWFSRGWTLQELIAPKSVIFVIKDWRVIGTKKSLRKKLAMKTGISQYVLVTGNVDRSSVACRMSWACNRVTTQTEDLAYCLMGIFDINMPLLYGEGDKAFIRLQEEIMRDSSDQTLFLW
ncbi:hypothetical protein P154DRAFT_417596, partial [Amniculicola lignicola CBS 123094]